MSMIMACCGTGEASTKNREIQKAINVDKRTQGRIMKLLLLGAGDSGKSTVAKQMKIIHLDGFTDEELSSHKTAIANNVIVAIKTLVQQSSKFGYSLLTDNEARANRIAEMPREQDPVITPDFAQDVVKLWEDPAIQKSYERASEYQLSDSSAYFFSNVTRMAATNYIPNSQDVLHSRVKTTGVLETAFDVEDITFRLVDVGGQRSERRKWIHCFDEVTAIIFCVAMSEYDLKLYEDNETNRMQESLQLFKELCNTKWFASTAFIIFLNKKDLFQQKIAKVPLTVCFPEYGGENSFTAGSEYIRDRFVALNENKAKTVYAHFTCATDTDNIKVVFHAVRDIILNKTLIKIGVM